MKLFRLIGAGLCLITVFGFTSADKDVSDAKSRLSALPHVSPELWKSLIKQHGWIFGAPSAKIKILGFLTPGAKEQNKNILFGSPTHQGDVICKTMMMPDAGAKTWTLASKLRIAYALMEPTKYKAPPIILNSLKQVGEPKNGDFAHDWDLVPTEIQQRAEAEMASYAELTKQIKLDTYYVLLPNDEVVEVGHPFNVEKVWNDYLLSKSQ